MTKRFGEFTALDDVSLKVPAGTLPRAARRERRRQEHAGQVHHGLLPAGPGRGAGRRPRAGNREPARRARARPRHGLPALHAGAGMTVAENLVLSRAHVPAVIDWRKETRRARGLSRRHAVPRSARRQGVGDLAPARSRRCEILKQLYLKRRFLILDEPTSVLTPGEADEVLGMLRDMVTTQRADGPDDHAQVPRGDGVRRRGHVLRRGRLAGAGRVADLTPDAMAGMMIGAQESDQGAARAVGEFGAPRLEIDRLGALDDAGQPALHDVSLTIKARRDRRHRRRLRQRPAGAGRGAGRPARGVGRRGSHRRRALPRDPRARCAGTSSRACRRSR